MKRKTQQPYRPYKPAAHYSPEELRQAEIADLEADYKCAIRDGLVDYAEKVKIQLERLKAQENPGRRGKPPGFVKTARDRRLWEEAEQRTIDEYGVKHPNFWAIANRIFHRMKARVGGGEYTPEENPLYCSLCGGPLMLLGKLGYLKHYTCRDCGMQFSRGKPPGSPKKKNPCGSRHNPCHRVGNPRDELGYIRSMTYGVMPSREEFSEAFGDEVYFSFGNDPRVGTVKLTEDELWEELQKALAEFEESDYPYSEEAGHWVSTVLDVLGFEWV